MMFADNMNAAGYILQCPGCSKPLVHFGSKVRRVHPVARFVTKHWVKMMFLSYPLLILTAVVLVWFYPSEIWPWMLGALLPLPPFLAYFMLRCFPIYRITECPYCGFYHEQRLGFSIAKDEL